MNYHTWTDYGYGFCIDNLTNYSFESIRKLCELNKETLSEFEDNLYLYLSDNTDMEYDDADINALVQYANEFDNIDVDSFLDERHDDAYEGYGIGYYLKDVIKRNEDIELYACEDFDSNHYLLFTPAYPWSDISEKQRNITKEEIDAIFRKYVNIVTDNHSENRIFDYQAVENGG